MRIVVPEFDFSSTDTGVREARMSSLRWLVTTGRG